MNEDTIRALSTKAEVNLRAASPDHLESLSSLGFPVVAIRFYEMYEPESYAQIGEVRLWPIADAVEENQHYVPGADVAPQGYLVFASNTCGDAYCFDVRSPLTRQDPPIVLLPHDEVFEGRTAEEIARYARPVAASLEDFLQNFVEERLETEPVYFPSE